MTASRFVAEFLHLGTLPDSLTGGKRLTDGII